MSDTENDRAFRYLTGALSGLAKPDAIGRKFAGDGVPITCPGNTMICHVDPASRGFGALLRAQETLKRGSCADGFAFLPPESFHMTIFEGVIDYDRRAERWPGHLPPDALVPEVTANLAQRLSGLKLDRKLSARPTGIFGGFSVRMTGADDAAEARLRTTRDRLQEACNIHRSDHVDYGFHITLAYNLRWFTA